MWEGEEEKIRFVKIEKKLKNVSYKRRWTSGFVQIKVFENAWQKAIEYIWGSFAKNIYFVLRNGKLFVRMCMDISFRITTVVATLYLLSFYFPCIFKLFKNILCLYFLLMLKGPAGYLNYVSQICFFDPVPCTLAGVLQWPFWYLSKWKVNQKYCCYYVLFFKQGD